MAKEAVQTNAENFGYFNPRNVYRPEILSIELVGEWNPNDGAINTYRITQNDGKIFDFDVKNGSGGSAGRSVTSVEQIQISTESLGKNIARIKFSDGTYTDVEIRNGAQGETGPQGERGPAGIDSVEASIGTNDPTQAPSVDKDLTEGVLSLTFNNIKGEKGNQGEPAVAVENYVTVEATSGMTLQDVLALLGDGSADTVYRVSNWDGTQYNTNAYTEYGWYDGAFKMLATRTPGIDDEPTAGSQKLVKSGGVAAQIGQLGQEINHFEDGELNQLIKEIYIDQSVIQGFDSFILSWYKDSLLYRISGISGGTTTIITQDAYSQNIEGIVELRTNSQWPEEGVLFGYMYLDTNKRASSDIFDRAIYNTDLPDNPAVYSYINLNNAVNGINNHIDRIEKGVFHVDDPELQLIVKEIYIAESVLSSYDSFILNWYKDASYIRITGIRNGVQQILTNDVFTQGTEYIKVLIDANGEKYGYALLDTTHVSSTDKYDVPIYSLSKNDNPIIYSNLLLNPIINTITATRNADNFNSIREIINAITDASELNQYVIFIPKGEWFECDINGKNYVKLVGESRDETIIYCDGTSTKQTPADYSISAYQNTPLNEIPEHNKHCFMQRFNIEIENLSVRINDAKYCIHVGASDVTPQNYNKLSAKHCKFIALENTNCPVGIGADGYLAEFEDCIFYDYQPGAIGVHCHNHPNATKPLYLNIYNSLFEGCGFLNAGEIGSEQEDIYNLINCFSTAGGDIHYYVDSSLSWINPSTGQQESDPSKYPYSIKINALGTNVKYITDNIYNDIITRPNAQKYIVCDHYYTIPAGAHFVGEVIKGLIGVENQLVISQNAKVIGVIEKIIDGVAYVAKHTVILHYRELTGGNVGDFAYVGADNRVTSVVNGEPIGVFGPGYYWETYKTIVLF